MWHLAWVWFALYFGRPFILHCFVWNIIALEFFMSASSRVYSCISNHTSGGWGCIWRWIPRISLYSTASASFLMKQLWHSVARISTLFLHLASNCLFLKHSEAALRHYRALRQRISYQHRIPSRSSPNPLPLYLDGRLTDSLSKQASHAPAVAVKNNGSMFRLAQPPYFPRQSLLMTY